jgi:hypothetical protein
MEGGHARWGVVDGRKRAGTKSAAYCLVSIAGKQGILNKGIGRTSLDAVEQATSKLVKKRVIREESQPAGIQNGKAASLIALFSPPKFFLSSAWQLF